MANSFELIDLKSGNVIADFSSEDDALESLQRRFQSHGAEAIAELSLMLITDDDQFLVAMQDDLEQLVRSSLRNRVA
jgi:hypothetical protein